MSSWLLLLLNSSLVGPFATKTYLIFCDLWTTNSKIHVEMSKGQAKHIRAKPCPPTFPTTIIEKNRATWLFSSAHTATPIL